MAPPVNKGMKVKLVLIVTIGRITTRKMWTRWMEMKERSIEFMFEHLSTASLLMIEQWMPSVAPAEQ